jgi:hypothetical protein
MLLYHSGAGGSLGSNEPWHPGFWAVQDTRREGVPDGGMACRSGNREHSQKITKGMINSPGSLKRGTELLHMPVF